MFYAFKWNFHFQKFHSVYIPKEKEASWMVFFSGGRWSDDTENRTAIIRTNGELETQKEWDREREDRATGRGTGPAGGPGCVLCVFAATIQGSWELPHDRFSEGSLYPVHTHTQIHTHTGHCRATQLPMQSTGNSHTPKIRCFFFFFYFPVKYTQVHASQTFILNDIWVCCWHCPGKIAKLEARWVTRMFVCL